jgi:hypothetical protein
VSSLESAVRPLDAARRGVLQLVTRSQLGRGVVGRRDVRLAWRATAQVVLLFLLAVRAPVALFFVGPLAFGVVHLAADVRYLVLRQTPPRALVGASVVAALLLTSLRLGVGVGLVDAAPAERLSVAGGALWVGFALAVGVLAKRSWAMAATLLPAFAALAGYLVSHAHLVTLLLVHAHNVIAVAVWLLLFRRRGAGWTMVPVALVVIFTVVLASGLTAPWTANQGGAGAFGERIESLGTWVAPGVETRLATTLATVFVFAQGVHYAIWTGWIPEDARRADGPSTFRQTVRSLTADFGARWLVAIGLIAAALPVAALIFDVRRSVVGYMTLAGSHAWFECAFLAYALVRGGFRPAAAA